MYLPTTREGMLAAIGRFIFETRIEPMTRELISRATEPEAETPRPTLESALAAVRARVRGDG